MRIKIRHIKGENKWESSESLDSSELDTKGLKGVIPSWRFIFVSQLSIFRPSRR